jgi:propionyl-CoA carboxylase beta chain
MLRELLSYLPSNNAEDPPFATTPSTAPIARARHLVPADPNKPYDMKRGHRRRGRRRHFLEVQEALRANIVVGFARLDGRAWASWPTSRMVLAGCLDIDASVKAARFVRFCDCFNIPLVTFVDVPGFLPGTDQEYGGIIKHGAKLLYAYAEATVPKITVITRKAYGGAYDVMASKHIRADLNSPGPPPRSP